MEERGWPMILYTVLYYKQIFNNTQWHRILLKKWWFEPLLTRKKVRSLEGKIFAAIVNSLLTCWLRNSRGRQAYANPPIRRIRIVYITGSFSNTRDFIVCFSDISVIRFPNVSRIPMWCMSIWRYRIVLLYAPLSATVDAPLFSQGLHGNRFLK